MAKFTYLGPAQETVAFGVTFPKGEAVEVKERLAVRKLSGNPCFEGGKRQDKQGEGEQEGSE